MLSYPLLPVNKYIIAPVNIEPSITPIAILNISSTFCPNSCPVMFCGSSGTAISDISTTARNNPTAENITTNIMNIFIISF